MLRSPQIPGRSGRNVIHLYGRVSLFAIKFFESVSTSCQNFSLWHIFVTMKFGWEFTYILPSFSRPTKNPRKFSYGLVAWNVLFPTAYSSKNSHGQLSRKTDFSVYHQWIWMTEWHIFHYISWSTKNSCKWFISNCSLKCPLSNDI